MKAYKYENLQIGNFLISIGYYLKEFNYTLPVSFNLYQQTPKDFTIGDLFGALAGKYFIIEFKNDKTNINDELKKPQRIKLINNLNNEYKDLKLISVKSHFICFPNFEEKSMDYILEPYVTISNKKWEELIIKGIQSFIEEMLTDGFIGSSFKEISSYIDLLNTCAKDKKLKTDNSSTSGIFLNFDQKEGIKYIFFDDLNFLNQYIRLEKEIIQEMLPNIQKNKQQDLDMEM